MTIGRNFAYAELITVAALLVRGIVDEDIDYPLCTSLRFRRADRKQREAANNYLRDLAMRIRIAADALKKAAPQ